MIDDGESIAGRWLAYAVPGYDDHRMIFVSRQRGVTNVVLGRATNGQLSLYLTSVDGRLIRAALEDAAGAARPEFSPSSSYMRGRVRRWAPCSLAELPADARRGAIEAGFQQWERRRGEGSGSASSSTSVTATNLLSPVPLGATTQECAA